MKKITFVITARPSYSRVKSVLRAVQKNSNLELSIIAAASLLLEKYGEVVNIIERDGFNINQKIYMVLEGENPITMAKTVAIGIMELSTIFANERPDIVVTIGDRFETIATAVAASYLNIPLAHIQGGEVTGSIDEKVRHAITKFSSLHFVANKKAAQRVRMMGEDPKFIYVTGCPSVDLAAEVLENPSFNFNFYEKYKGVGSQINLDQDFIVVLNHPITTEYKSASEQMNEILSAVTELKIPTIMFWPNVDAGSDKTSGAIRKFRERENPDFIYFLKNMEPEDFLKLLLKSKGIIGNSSVGIRECAFLGVPAVNIGTRQKGRERAGNVIDVDYKKEEIVKAMLSHFKNSSKYPSSSLYGDGKAGERIARILSEVTPSVDKHFID